MHVQQMRRGKVGEAVDLAQPLLALHNRLAVCKSREHRRRRAQVDKAGEQVAHALGDWHSLMQVVATKAEDLSRRDADRLARVRKLCSAASIDSVTMFRAIPFAACCGLLDPVSAVSERILSATILRRSFAKRLAWFAAALPTCFLRSANSFARLRFARVDERSSGSVCTGGSTGCSNTRDEVPSGNSNSICLPSAPRIRSARMSSRLSVESAISSAAPIASSSVSASGKAGLRPCGKAGFRPSGRGGARPSGKAPSGPVGPSVSNGPV